MCKTKKFLFIIGLAMILSSTAYARVCFLGGGNDFDGDGEPDDNCLSGFVASTSNCPGYSTCAAPKKGAKACLDSGSKFYLPEDCCSNSSLYTSCDTSAGYVCSGTKCTGIDADGEEYTACDGECKCDSKYKYDCAALGKIGVGASCGGKYTECKCDLDKFHKCGSNATGSGPTCTDGSVTYHSNCSCPTTGNWTSNLDNCCAGAQDTCTNSSGKIYYECKDNPSAATFGCVCGTTKQSGNAGCINGCTDSSYSYIGSADRVTCGESVSFINGQTGICGNNCHCSPGYYEYSDLCSQQESDVCDALGYTDVTCPDEWLACPFNSSKKKCFSNNCFNYEEFCTDQTSNFCATLGYTETSCSGDFIGCPLNANIKKCLGEEESLAGCAIGDVFYADGSCGNVENYDSSKVAVGVVYALSAEKGDIPYTTAEAEADGFTAPHGRVIALRNLTSNASTYAFNPENPYYNSSNTFYFGLSNTDIDGLTNYSKDDLLNAFKNSDPQIYSGKENTAIISAQKSEYSMCQNYSQGTSNYNKLCNPNVANATLSFYPPEVEKNNSLVGAGKWYLPSLGELALLYGLDISQMTQGYYSSGATGTTKTIVNATLNTLANKGIDASQLTREDYWSSLDCEPQYKSDNTYTFDLDTGRRFIITTYRSYERYTFYVRPSLEF